MPLNIGYDASGLDGKLRMVLDSLIASLQTWVGGQEGINAAQRLDELTSGIDRLASVPTGSIFMWGTGTAPSGYVLLDGGTLGRTTHATLYALWGTTYGAGDGATTFNVPDLRQRFPLGKAASGTGSTLGATGGAIDHTHTGGTVSGSTASESSHTHGAGSYVTPAHAHGNATDGDGAQTEEVQAGTGSTILNHPGHFHTIDSQAAMSISGTSGAGSSHSHSAGTLAVGTSGSNNPPYFVVNYIVKT